jgi:hypothetical protein
MPTPKAAKRSAQIALSKDPDSGKAVATIYTAADVTLADMSGLAGKLYTDVFKKNGRALGLKICEGCRSGLDRLIFKDIVSLPQKDVVTKVTF